MTSTLTLIASAIFVLLVSVFLPLFLRQPLQRIVTDAELKAMDFTFDIIVVGAGTAGSLIAAEIARHSNMSVLLLEEGGKARTFPLSEQSVPGFAPLNQIIGAVSRQISFQPMKSELKGTVPPNNPQRVVDTVRGIGLGGTYVTTMQCLLWISPHYQYLL